MTTSTSNDHKKWRGEQAERANETATNRNYKHQAGKLDVCLSMHHCICVEKKNQLHATEWFIAFIMCSTSFGYFYAHHQELKTICVLLLPIVCDVLVAGCWRSGVGQPAMRSG